MGLIQDNPGIDRTELALSVGVSNAAITNIVNELLIAGIVTETNSQQNLKHRGRRRVGLQIENKGGFVLGINVLASYVSIVLADINGNLIEEKEVKPKKIKDPADTFTDIKTAADILLTEHRVPLSRLFGVGFSVAGYLDKKRETLERAPYIGWPSFDLKNKLQNMFGKIVTVENVTRCVALAESKFGALKGLKDLVLIRSALGLGGAIITGGQLLNGNQNFAGDLGHILAVPEGKICSCGNCGCLNTVASGWAIMNKLGTTDKSYETANQFLTQNIQLRNLLNSESSNKVNVNAAAVEAGEALAKHLFTTLQILNPKVVCLTGPLGRHKKYSESFRNTIISMGFDQKIILASERDIITPAMASVYLALSELVYSPSFNFEQIFSSNQNKVVSK